jgi:type VI protein secretion system component VasF
MFHEEYLKRRDELLSIRTDSMGSFDKTILSLATGGLALSIVFLDKIGAPFDVATYQLIAATWLSLLGVIIANLLSYIFAKWNMDRKIKQLDDRYRDPKPESNTVEKTFWQRTATDVLNYLALACFVLAVLFFTVYLHRILLNKCDAQLSRQLNGVTK